MPSFWRAPTLPSHALNCRMNQESTGGLHGACRPLSVARPGENVVRLAVSAVNASPTHIGEDATEFEDLRTRRVSEPFSISQFRNVIIVQTDTCPVDEESV